MKKMYLILSVYLLAMVSGVRADEPHRDFTDTQGRTIRGRVVAVDPQAGTVRIERDNRRTAEVPISIFSETDQTYILEWDASKKFMSESLLKISCDKKRVGKRKEEEWADVTREGGGVSKELMNETTFESFLYELKFYCRNKSGLKDLRVEYIVYYEQSEKSWEEPVVKQKFLADEIAIPLLEKEITVSTKPVEIFRDNISGKTWVGGGSRTGGKGDIHGIRARLYMKIPSGKELVREFFYPERLSEEKFPWKD